HAGPSGNSNRSGATSARKCRAPMPSQAGVWKNVAVASSRTSDSHRSSEQNFMKPGRPETPPHVPGRCEATRSRGLVMLGIVFFGDRLLAERAEDDARDGEQHADKGGDARDLDPVDAFGSCRLVHGVH